MKKKGNFDISIIFSMVTNDDIVGGLQVTIVDKEGERQQDVR